MTDVESMTFGRNGNFPNSRFPVLVYRSVIAAPVTEEAMRSILERNGWPVQWVDTVFSYDHYHSTAHETLGVVAGEARLGLGGPGGGVLEIGAGDVVVIPAGVAHRLDGSSTDFAVAGALSAGAGLGYSQGREGRMGRGYRKHRTRSPAGDRSGVRPQGSPDRTVARGMTA